MIPTGAYVQQPASTGQATVGYLDIRNNGTADSLLSVSTSVGGTVALRGPVPDGESPIVMRTVTSIPIPAAAPTRPRVRGSAFTRLILPAGGQPPCTPQDRGALAALQRG